MLNNLLGKKKAKLRRPEKELNAAAVPASRFNEMIDYYTSELKARLKEITDLQEQNRMLIQTALKQQNRAAEISERMAQTQQENVALKKKLVK